MELQLTDSEAQQFIKIAKEIIKKYKINISTHPRGTILIKSQLIDRDFILYYFYSVGNIHLNFADSKTHLTLVRINIDNSFHKNSDGIIRGNRVEIFSEQEFIAKGDGRTHYKAYPLPFDSIKNTDDFFMAFENILEYTNTQENGMISMIPTLPTN